MTENWYLVLDLPFDPPEINEQVIEERIEEKRKFWASNSNDFNKGAQYRKYRESINEIKKDMLGQDNIREQLIEDACLKTYQPIDKILKGINKKEISSLVIERIAKSQKVDLELVKKRAAKLGSKIVKEKEEDFQPIYDKYYKKRPEKAEKFNDYKDDLKTFNSSNLYDFLYQGRDIQGAAYLPCEELRKHAQSKRKDEFQKNDAKSGTGSKLCTLCVEVFTNEASKKVYDQYLEYSKRKDILDNSKEIYKITDGISLEQYKEVLGQLTESMRDSKLAESVFVAFCKVEKIPLPFAPSNDTEKSDFVICRCGYINDNPKGGTCQQCGLKLQIMCPKCKTLNKNSIKFCGNCGFDFENIDKAMALCELARESLDQLNFILAKTHLSRVDQYWPRYDKASKLKAQISQLESTYNPILEKIQLACKDKKFFLAQDTLKSIKNHIPRYSNPRLENEINSAIEAANKYKNKAQTSNNERDIIEACSRAYEIARDCPGIDLIIGKYPPKSGRNLLVSPDPISKINVISWAPSQSQGIIFYHVVRKEEAIPLNIKDGEYVGKVSMITINDLSVLPGRQYYYGVFAERAGVFSKGLMSTEPTTNLFEISGLAVRPGDRSLGFNWELIADNAKVMIEREDNGKITKLTTNNKTTYIDKDLVNDTEYRYKIYLIYSLGPNKIKTKGISISGTPTKPPQPIDKLIVRPLENDSFQLEWENPENSEIEFFYSEKRPDFLSGDLLALSELESIMKPLLVKKTGDLKATFSYSKEGLIYIVAAAIKSSSAVVGSLVKATHGGQVKVNDIKLINGRIMISIDKVKEATGFVVLYRHDKFPEGLSDPNTKRIYIPLKQVEYDNGLFIDDNEPKEYFFTVFAEFKRDGERDYSVGSDYIFSNVSKEVITYTVDLSKKLFYSNILTITFESENRDFTLPDIDIMSSVGVAPMFKKSGSLFHQIEEQEVKSSAKVKIKLDKTIAKNTFIKAFLKDESLQSRYQLQLKVNSKLKIS